MTMNLMMMMMLMMILLLLLEYSLSLKSVLLKTSSSSSSSLLLLSKMTLSLTKIALTREEGANDKLKSLLKKYECIEIPCIMFETGSDIDKLPEALKVHDIIVITSPQAANVFLSAWEKTGKPNIKVATVGKGSSKPLIAKGINPVFEPSDSTAETLALELPSNLGNTILYPSSAIAENTLEKGLQNRNFKVTRLNTYNTVPAIWTSEQEALAKSVDIVTFGSPSAVKTWAEKVGTDFTAVVIGPTSFKSAEKLGYTKVIAPENGSKGIEAWAQAISNIADKLN